MSTVAVTGTDTDGATDEVVAEAPSASGAWVTVLTTAGAIVVGIGLGGGLIAIAGGSPISAYLDMLEGSVGSWRALGRLANQAAPLALIAFGYAIAFRIRFFAIGAQAQHDVGGLAAGALVLNVGLGSAWIGIPAAVVVGVVAAVLLGAFVAMLRNRFGVNEVISSLMLTYAAFYLLSWAVRRPLRNPDGFIPESARIPSWAQAPNLFGSDLHLTVAIALVAVPLLMWLLSRTPFGFQTDVAGRNADAARSAGLPVRRLTMLAATGAAAFAGMAGVLRLLSSEGRLSQGFSTQLGFTAIVVALLGRLRPIGIVAAAMFMAALEIGGEVMQREQDIPKSVSIVIQALVVILVLVANRLANRRTVAS